MKTPVLGRWIRRSRPRPVLVARAVVSGLVASLAGVALFVGAIALLVESSRRPGLAAVGAGLIVLEILAFLRSPLRFGERLSAHRLGYAVVGQWRQWLFVQFARLDATTRRRIARGDVLERALRDTDQLQDLWLRGLVPLVLTGAVALTADVALAVLPARGPLWPVALGVAGSQVAAVGLLLAGEARALAADRRLRHRRSAFTQRFLELGAVAPELFALGRRAYLDASLGEDAEQLARAEVAVQRAERATLALGPLSGLAALGVLAGHPPMDGRWLVVAVLLSLSSVEVVDGVRHATAAMREVVASAERLDALAVASPTASRPLDSFRDLAVTDLGVTRGTRTLVSHGELRVRAGERVALLGVSGSGKSTVLEILAGLDHPDQGEVRLNGQLLADYEESSLRRRVAYVPSEPDLWRGYALDAVGLGRIPQRDWVADAHALDVAVNPRDALEGLSRGQAQRLGVVRALVGGAELLVLDEPTSALGARETTLLLTLLGEIGVTVVVATHDERVIAWCTKQYELRDGSLRQLPV